MGQPRYDATRNQFVQTGPGGGDATVYTASGALALTDGVHAINKAVSLAAMTLAVPGVALDGMRMLIVARTAFAHTVTVAGGLGGNAADDVITFAKVGDNIELVVENGKFVPVGAGYGVVIS